VHEAVGRAASIDGWMREPELEWLFDTARSLAEHAVVVEIGCWRGRSTVAICEGLAAGPGARAWAVDHFRGDSGAERSVGTIDPNAVRRDFRANTARYDFLTLLVADSVAASATFQDRSVDWVFIDADHAYAEVSRDIRVWARKLKHGGLISGHDFDFHGVRDAVLHAFVQVGSHSTIWFTTGRRRPEAMIALRRCKRALARGR
jgi:predicted O-methyltransferase YrrM